MRSIVRLAAILSTCAFIALALHALPDHAECMAPDVRFQRAWIVGGYVAFTMLGIGAALLYSRARPLTALAFLLVAHVSASRALERVELTYPSDDRAHAVHAHGPWALLRTHDGDGDGTAPLEMFRFAR